MEASTAQCLLQEIGPWYKEKAGQGRSSVHLQEQVLMLLHFCAYQGKYGLLSEKFGITRSCYHHCVDGLLDICVQNLLPKYIKWPSAERQKETAFYFNERYRFPGVIGAIDGTHITLTKPPGDCFPEDYFSIRKKIYTMLLQVNIELCCTSWFIQVRCQLQVCVKETKKKFTDPTHH